MPSRLLATRGRKVTAGLLVGVLAGLGGYALAAFFLNAGVNGGVKSGMFRVAWVVPVTYSPMPSTIISNATLNGPNADQLHLDPGDGYFPGDSVTVTSGVRVTGNTDGRLVGMHLGLPDGVTVSLGSQCGKVITSNTETPVSFTISVDDSAALDGSTHTFPTTAGLEIAPVSQPFSGTCDYS